MPHEPNPFSKQIDVAFHRDLRWSCTTVIVFGQGKGIVRAAKGESPRHTR